MALQNINITLKETNKKKVLLFQKKKLNILLCMDLKQITSTVLMILLLIGIFIAVILVLSFKMDIFGRTS